MTMPSIPNPPGRGGDWLSYGDSLKPAIEKTWNDTHHGGVRYIWDAAAAKYVLAAGQTEDGVSARDYMGPSTADPTAQTGHVARLGDLWIKTS